MKDNVVVFPVSSGKVSISEELMILKAQDLMMQALFDADACVDEDDQDYNVHFSMLNLSGSAH